MALRVWLPLNGDLTNQGLSDINASGSLIYSDSGKIGKCANVDSRHVLTIPYTFGAAYDFSFSFWIKIPTAMSSNTSWEQMLGFRAINTANSTTVSTVVMNFADYHQVKIYDDANHQHSWRTPTYDVWEHWSIVHHSTESSSNIKFYINGILHGSYDTSHPLILQNGNIQAGNGVSVGSFALNDFRIYDHALSPKEVKELAKGLILHYRLTGPGQKNLLSQYVTCGGNNPGDTSGGGRMQYAGDYKIIIPVIEDRDTYFSLWTTTPLTQGKQYTISCYVEGLLPTSYYQFPLYEQGNGSMGNFKLDHNGLCKLTFTMNYTKTVPTANVGGKTYYRIFMDDNSRKLASGQLNSPIILTNFKIEEGTIATHWCPEPGADLYTLLGYNNNIEYDCSGYSRNGIKIGNIIWDIDSPRYTTSYKMISSNVGTSTNSGMATIYSNNGLTTPSAMTIAFWLKPIQWNYQDSGLLSTTMESYPTDYLTSAINQYDGTFRFNASDGSSLNISATSLVNDFLWHHYSFAFDGINVKVYKDGALTNLGKSFSSAKTLGSFKKIFIGLSQAGGAWRQTSAYWSDFRVYATALSAADILELYEAGGAIDSHYNSYVYEYITDDSNEYLNSQGISGISDLEETDENTKWLSTGKIESNNFYEI